MFGYYLCQSGQTRKQPLVSLFGGYSWLFAIRLTVNRIPPQKKKKKEWEWSEQFTVVDIVCMFIN